MNTPVNDGGPAFPLEKARAVDGSYYFPAEHTGMTLRDYFAAKAMQAIFGGVGAQQVADRDGRYNETNWAQVVAANAYEMADAMLATRNKQP